MGNFHITDKIGEVIQPIDPDAYASDVAFTAAVGVPIKNALGVLFILSAGDLTGGTLDASLYYSSTGTSSDAVGTDAAWESSDAAWAQVTSDGENEVYLLDIITGNKDLSDAAGTLVINVEAVGANDFSVVGFPYGMSYSPSTNANTVVQV
jgi:hypothetical protein